MGREIFEQKMALATTRIGQYEPSISKSEIEKSGKRS
jgi:hypothetical protein